MTGLRLGSPVLLHEMYCNERNWPSALALALSQVKNLLKRDLRYCSSLADTAPAVAYSQMDLHT
jgi:hypothetical protein